MEDGMISARYSWRDEEKKRLAEKSRAWPGTCCAEPGCAEPTFGANAQAKFCQTHKGANFVKRRQADRLRAKNEEMRNAISGLPLRSIGDVEFLPWDPEFVCAKGMGVARQVRPTEKALRAIWVCTRADLGAVRSEMDRRKAEREEEDRIARMARDAEDEAKWDMVKDRWVVPVPMRHMPPLGTDQAGVLEWLESSGEWQTANEILEGVANALGWGRKQGPGELYGFYRVKRIAHSLWRRGLVELDGVTKETPYPDRFRIARAGAGRWVCESCGGAIESVEHGWVEWLKNPRTGESKGLRLVHQRCHGPLAGILDGCCYSLKRDDGFHVFDHHLTAFIVDGKPSVDRLRDYGAGMDVDLLGAAIAAGVRP